MLLNINYDENYVLVGLDFLSTTTDHYGIRPHEIAKFLGEDGFIGIKIFSIQVRLGDYIKTI